MVSIAGTYSLSLVVWYDGYSWDCKCSKWCVSLYIQVMLCMLSVPAASKVFNYFLKVIYEQENVCTCTCY